MMTHLLNREKISLDAEIEKIVAAYSASNQEELTGEFLNVIKTSEVVKILDENRDCGFGALRNVLHVCLRLGKIDTSLAWVVGVSNAAWSMQSCFHSLGDAILEMDRNKIMAMVLGRPGLLKKDKGSDNYLLTGEWKYASGWRYASFFFCLATIEGVDSKTIRVVAVPSKHLELAGDWRATGLRGTQSVTVRANNVSIPGNYIENYSSILSGEYRKNNVSVGNKKQISYAGLFTGVLMNCLLGSILGATEAALEYVVTAVGKSPVAGSTYAIMGDSGAIRAEIGRISGALDLYKRAAEYNADIIDKAAYDPTITLSVHDRVSNRARATLIMRGCVNIIQDLLWIYGSSGLDKGCVLEKIWRDVNVGARHGGFSKLVPEEALGLSVIGRDPKDITLMF